MMITNRRSSKYILIVLIFLYCIAEAIAFLTGIRVIAYSSIVFQSLIIGSICLGIPIEMNLAFLSQEILSTKSLPFGQGFMYMIPIVAGFAGQIVGWALGLSIMFFVALLLRLACSLSHIAKKR